MKFKLNTDEAKLLKKVSGISSDDIKGAYNIRKDGKAIERVVTDNINIVTKEDKTGIDIYIKENTVGEQVHIPVIISKSGLKDVVYNDFHVGKNAQVTIIAGCGIHNCSSDDSEHDGIHRFFLEENAKVTYIEKHYGSGNGTGKKILNPRTEVNLKKGASLVMDSLQISGVDSTIRETYGKLEEDANLVVTEKIITDNNQYAKTIFEVSLDGENSSCKVTSRSIAKDTSYQEFVSKISGNTKCFGHVECDAIIMDKAKVIAIPEIDANNVDARLIHEAAIGKIAGEQLTKLMSLGLSEKQAEKQIINGFLK